MKCDVVTAMPLAAQLTHQLLCAACIRGAAMPSAAAMKRGAAAAVCQLRTCIERQTGQCQLYPLSQPRQPQQRLSSLPQQPRRNASSLLGVKAAEASTWLWKEGGLLAHPTTQTLPSLSLLPPVRPVLQPTSSSSAHLSSEFALDATGVTPGPSQVTPAHARVAPIAPSPPLSPPQTRSPSNGLLAHPNLLFVECYRVEAAQQQRPRRQRSGQGQTERGWGRPPRAYQGIADLSQGPAPSPSPSTIVHTRMPPDSQGSIPAPSFPPAPPPPPPAPPPPPSHQGSIPAPSFPPAHRPAAAGGGGAGVHLLLGRPGLGSTGLRQHSAAGLNTGSSGSGSSSIISSNSWGRHFSSAAQPDPSHGECDNDTIATQQTQVTLSHPPHSFITHPNSSVTPSARPPAPPIPGPPSPAPLGERVEVSRLYNRYLTLLQQLTPHFAPEDPAAYRAMFVSQIEAELRCQHIALLSLMKEQERRLQRQEGAQLTPCPPLLQLWATPLAAHFDSLLTQCAGVSQPGPSTTARPFASDTCSSQGSQRSRRRRSS
ncbi:hypothetical protein V8C86DRAFT_491076 [Haematococcus lacustris]